MCSLQCRRICRRTHKYLPCVSAVRSDIKKRSSRGVLGSFDRCIQGQIEGTRERAERAMACYARSWPQDDPPAGWLKWYLSDSTTSVKECPLDMHDRIRSILAAYGKMPVDPRALADDDDLHERGLTSHASVNVMLAIEDEFDIEFPDELLQKSTFSTVSNLANVVKELTETSSV